MTKIETSNAAHLALVTAWQRDRNVNAHDELTAAYRPIIERKVDTFRVWQARAASRENLIAAGWAGLIQAIDTFDPAAGLAFGGYAHACIQDRMRRFAGDLAGLDKAFKDAA